MNMSNMNMNMVTYYGERVLVGFILMTILIMMASMISAESGDLRQHRNSS